MPRRIFIGLTEIAGYFGNLQRGFEEIGIPATFVDEAGHPFGYRRLGVLGRIGRAAVGLQERQAAAGWSRPLWRSLWLFFRVARLPLRVGLFTLAVARHDVFIMSAGVSFLPRHADLPLLRLLGKRLIWVFSGTDHRPPYLNGRTVRAVAGDPGALAGMAAAARARIRIVERHAHAIVALPASSHFHSRPVHSYLRIGVPFAEPEAVPEGADPFGGSGVRILHSPSDPPSKGTAEIRAAIDELRGRGHAIDYVEIIRRPHAEVLGALRACDFVVDEVYSDTPMAVFATEAASFGKPAVVTGYYAALLDSEVPGDEIPPTHFDLPERLVAAIELLVTDDGYRRELGERARRFVRERWAPRMVAGRYLELIDGRGGDAWRWEPSEQRYLLGWGMPAAMVVDTIRRLLDHGGTGSLHLDHHPALRDRFVRLARQAAEEPAAIIPR